MARDPHQIDLEDYDGVSPGYARPEEAASLTPGRAISAKRMIPPFEKQRRVLPVELEFAARQIVKDFLLATVGPRVAARDGNKPPVKGKRDINAEIRDAKSTIELIRAQFGDQVLRDIEWFIAAVTTRPDGTPMRFADSGTEIAPGKSPEAQKWAGYGALYRTLTVLARFYSRQRALGKLDAPATEQDRQELQSLLASLAQQRRIRGI